jgi:putative thioredoxin
LLDARTNALRGLRAVVEAGDLERAAAVIAPVAVYSRDAAVKQLAARVRLRQAAADQAAAGGDRAAFEARLAADGDDARAHYALGTALVAAEEWEAGLEHLLDAVRLDRTLDGGASRVRLLDALEVLGVDHVLSREFRARLANVLF